MTYVNLTPHPVCLYRERGISDGPAEIYPPSGTVARVSSLECGPPDGDVVPVRYGDPQQLPPPVPGVLYIVSLVTALACRERGDLVAPYLEVRNGKGGIVGCRYLQRTC
jgi:hypothetical protein